MNGFPVTGFTTRWFFQWNVADVISPPVAGADAKMVNTWAEEEVLRFLKHAKESRYYVPYSLAITCGMRNGEILGLQWKDIDFERRTLSVNRSLSPITKEFHDPKTSTGKRLIHTSCDYITCFGRTS
ncbi:site-specific integrase [Bacillus pseudomycoides]|uniref:site-specific integrase n=1 Tax=Bacillus pseudomycoides TaxID=64104 RepID=UPI0001A166CE|nr:site-specific integrase [Bacillus pseudomycoides]EEM04364.1 DNA integration/recombination/invertion protein [Bacillus pseudomycoides]PFW92951.1 site-specific integrase [Bacillus pseudomycoides]PFX41507.1 site-specific integrase [Bacillus pseudomycoides]